MSRLLERLIPASALVWDEDHPFADDHYVVWNDPRWPAYVASLPKVRDLLPMFRASRGPIVFQTPNAFRES